MIEFCRIKAAAPSVPFLLLYPCKVMFYVIFSTRFSGAHDKFFAQQLAKYKLMASIFETQNSWQ